MNEQQEQTLLSNVAVIRSDVEHITESIKKHDETLYGNSQEGMVSRVKGLEKRRESQRRLNWIILTSTIGGLLTIISGVVMAYILQK